MTMAAHARDTLAALGHDTQDLDAGDLTVRTPIDGSTLAALRQHKPAAVAAAADSAQAAFARWRAVPAPVRGELLRLLAMELRAEKEPLGNLVTLECGKILTEGHGEVQEMIDICDFAVGLSRQLYGLTIASERPGHHMRELWHPLGPVGVISAFNFPVAVWAWNAALALVCGNPVIWKPSEKTPLTALACGRIFARTVEKFRAAGHDAPDNLLQILIGGRTLGEALADHPGVPLLSATGSTGMGRAVNRRVAARLGRCLLELGGNNAMIVTPTADLDLAVQAILFAAVGTAGQRCTTLRRLIVHDSVADDLTARLLSAYHSIRIGNPLDPEILMGPLIGSDAFYAMLDALKQAKKEGGTVLTGGDRVGDRGFYATPALVAMKSQSAMVQKETFAPILYIMRYSDFTDAVTMQNEVPQGLSSCIFTGDVRESESFLSATGSDCGIANVNIGPNGAEIGGAFGGEKDTGGGRESGSDAWKSYMRRQTQTVNYSAALPLAQGVEFPV